MKCVAVVGVGLIGGSFARALRSHGFEGRILGVSSESTLQSALAAGVIDQGVALEEAIPQADLVLLAHPISRILTTIDSIGPLLRPECLVTDVGSTKQVVVARAAQAIRSGVFVGGHPMAGKESRGVEQSDAGLFLGRTWFLTPEHAEAMERPAVLVFLEWLRKIGAVPVVISPEEHDRLVSLSSHLPQLLSTILASMLEESLGKPEARLAAGPGLHDMTRLAMSSFDIWSDIVATNPERIAEALDQFVARLIIVRDQLRIARGTGEDLWFTLGPLFSCASEFARALRKPNT
jgi:prephenate dehydrogenase